MATACLVASLSMAASAASQPTERNLGAMLLDSPDVPPGFTLDPQHSGPSKVHAALPGWAPQAVRDIAAMHGYDRMWIHKQERRAIIAQVLEYPLEILAGADVNSTVQDFRSTATEEFSIPAVPHAYGFVVKERDKDAARGVYGIYAQGPRAFNVAVITSQQPRQADVALTRQLVEIQANKAPAGSTRLVDIGESETAARAALGALGAGLAYIAGLSLLAWLRDPLARRSARPTSPPTASLKTTIIDVTAQARRRRRRAAARLVLEVSGVGVALSGLLPFTWPAGLLFVVLGVGLALAPRLVTAATRRRDARPPALWTGRRRFAVACATFVATVCVLAGLLAMVLYGVGAVVTSPAYADNIRIVLAGGVLLAAGTLAQRGARRLAALDAHEMRQRDPRPMVLYLRGFADDKLAIRTATSARKPLLDRLSPRRFDRFEEVLARHLHTTGPVVALNPPGTRLPPLGSARATFSADDWKPAVAGWMSTARLIVVSAAPEVVTPGLKWELDTIDSQRWWSKSLLVLPPLPARTIRARWEQFSEALADTAMARHAVPTDPARILALVGSPATGWLTVTANQRTEWSYAEALTVASTTTTPNQTTPTPDADT